MFKQMFGTRSTNDDVTVVEARRRQADGALVLDVRESAEWAGGHVPEARHIPLSQLTPRLGELPKDRDLLVICRSGNRSARAVELLRRSGFARVTNVAGGVSAWATAGLPVTRG